MVIERNRKDKSLSISQTKYLIKILKRFNIFDCKPASTPLETSAKLTKELSPDEPKEIEVMKDIPYSTVVGCLIHAITTTRIDLAYSNCQVSKFMANLNSIHWTIIKKNMI